MGGHWRHRIKRAFYHLHILAIHYSRRNAKAPAGMPFAPRLPRLTWAAQRI